MSSATPTAQHQVDHCYGACKLTKLCYLATSFQQPGYLADLISPYSQPRLLRSFTQKLLSVPPHNAVW